MVRQTWASSNDLAGASPHYSGKRTAESKGVRSDMEYEGSRKQITGLTNRNLIPRRLPVGEAAQEAEAR